MKKVYLLKILCVAVILLGKNSINAQSLPVGTPVLEDYYRRMQLLGQVDPDISFSVRPLFPKYFTKNADVYRPDSNSLKDDYINLKPIIFGRGYGEFQILPISWQQQYNSNHPYGWNDGAMIPARGYQTLVSGGFFVKYGPLSIQLRPEFVYAQNKNFDGFASGHSDQDLAGYYAYYNFIDWPERYGNSSYNKVFWGQSSVRLTFGPISAGLSNENVWWGPGIKNALILSNNAPGFKHITINTVRPVKTFIGSFEGQILAGKLESSGLPSLGTTSLSTGAELYIPKRNDWRYFTGFNINYHPKWIPGLTIGLTRTFDAYKEDVKGFKAYFPFFTAYSKVISGVNGDPFPRDQYTSVYSRWVFTKAEAEIYFEYGLNDNSYNLRDFVGSPQHSRAYLFGLRKMLLLPGKNDDRISFRAEITQLSQTPDRIVRDAGGWYVHGEVTDGQTNMGQILGAGTGSGGNLQSVDLSWISGLKKLGIGLDRYEHNVDYSNAYFPDINGNSRKWVDFAFALNGEWNYKNFLFSAKLQEIKSLNYEWILKDYDAGKYYIPHNDVYNLHGQLGVTFRF